MTQTLLSIVAAVMFLAGVCLGQQQIPQSSSARALVFFMADSTDHVTGKTGLTPTVTLSKNGASFAAAAGSVSEIGAGWYKVAGNATDSNTLGALVLHATATGADPADKTFVIVAIDDQDAEDMGLTKLDATISSRATQTSVDGIDPSAIAEAVWDEPLAGHTTDGTAGLTLASAENNIAETLSQVNIIEDRVDTEVAAIKAKTDQLTFTAANKVDATAETDIDPAEIWSYGQRTLSGGPLIAVNQQQSTVKTIVRGNSYSASARSLLITVGDGAEWPTDLSEWTWSFIATKHPDNEEEGEAEITGTVTVINATGSSRSVRVDLTATQTASMAPGLYRTSIRGTKDEENSSINVAVWPVVDDPAQE